MTNARHSTTETYNQLVEETFISKLIKPYDIDFIKKVFTSHIETKNQHKRESIRKKAPMLAVKHDRIDVLKWLVNDMEYGSNDFQPNNHPIIAAIQYQRPNALTWLIENVEIESIAGYCVEACIIYNNLPALQEILLLEEIHGELDEKPLIPTGNNKQTENVITLTMKYTRHSILIWLIEEYEYIFVDSMINEKKETMQKFLHYLKELNSDFLESLEKAFQKSLEFINLQSEIDVINETLNIIKERRAALKGVNETVSLITNSSLFRSTLPKEDAASHSHLEEDEEINSIICISTPSMTLTNSNSY